MPLKLRSANAKKKKKKPEETKISYVCKHCETNSCDFVHKQTRPDVPLVLPFQSTDRARASTPPFTPAFSDGSPKVVHDTKGQRPRNQSLKMPAQSMFWPAVDSAYPAYPRVSRPWMRDTSCLIPQNFPPLSHSPPPTPTLVRITLSLASAIPPLSNSQ